MSKKGRAIVVFCGRFPSEKADSLFAHENAKAFQELGIETVLVAPKRLHRRKLGARPYEVAFLPTIDLFRIPILWSIANLMNLLVFSTSLYVWLRRHASPDDFVLCNEPLPLLVASFAMKTTLFEIHILPVRHQWFYRTLFQRIFMALPINDWNAKLAEKHGLSRERIVVARSAVDVETFSGLDKPSARARLGLGREEYVALYTGHLFEWKGVGTLAAAARLVPDTQVYFVGGTDIDIRRFEKAHAGTSNVHVIGFVRHDEIPYWQAAADVLVLPNSGKQKISKYYTSPMKLFEYMASARPILASDLPSIREILSDESAYFATADDAASFARALKRIHSEPEEAALHARKARTIAEDNTWRKRAERIVGRLEKLRAA